jgi:hypothetical protein
MEEVKKFATALTLRLADTHWLNCDPLKTILFKWVSS